MVFKLMFTREFLSLNCKTQVELIFHKIIYWQCLIYTGFKNWRSFLYR